MSAFHENTKTHIFIWNMYSPDHIKAKIERMLNKNFTTRKKPFASFWRAVQKKFAYGWRPRQEWVANHAIDFFLKRSFHCLASFLRSFFNMAITLPYYYCIGLFNNVNTSLQVLGPFLKKKAHSYKRLGFWSKEGWERSNLRKPELFLLRIVYAHSWIKNVNWVESGYVTWLILMTIIKWVHIKKGKMNELEVNC